MNDLILTTQPVPVKWIVHNVKPTPAQQEVADFLFPKPNQPRPAKPARRQSSLTRLAMSVLAESGQMTKPELVAAIAVRQAEAGKQPYACNIYGRLRALVAGGQIESMRMDRATWLSLPGHKPGKRGRRHTIQGHAVVRLGKARFEAKAEGCPAYSGNATLTFIKP